MQNAAHESSADSFADVNRDHHASTILVSQEGVATFGANDGKSRASKGG
jgi:hypothetical protein